MSAKHSGITNVGSPHAISYSELANLIGKLLNEDVTKQFELAQDPQSLLPDVEKLAIETGQTNFTTIEKACCEQSKTIRLDHRRQGGPGTNMEVMQVVGCKDA